LILIINVKKVECSPIAIDHCLSKDAVITDLPAGKHDQLSEERFSSSDGELQGKFVIDFHLITEAGKKVICLSKYCEIFPQM
jgi:hypothetical protein